MSNVYSGSKLALHKEKLEALRKGKVSAPIYVRVKPTNVCNHHCFNCGYEQDSRRTLMDRTSSIPQDKMMEILRDIHDTGVKAITYSGGGEPLIYRHITEAMQRTLDYGIDLSIITNGQELSGEKTEVLSHAKWVRISLSESDAKTFAESRGVPQGWFHKLVEGIRNFARIKSRDCELGINFVVQAMNYSQVFASARFFKGLGANHIKITPSWTTDFLDYHRDLRQVAVEQIRLAREELEDDQFSVYDTYEKDFQHCGIYEREYPKCLIMQCIPVIGADSNVYLCHDKAYDPKGVLGSLKDTSFRELWFSEESRRRFEQFDPRVECNHHCANDEKNMIGLELISKPEEVDKHVPASNKHENFI